MLHQHSWFVTLYYQQWLDGDNHANIPPNGESGAQMEQRVLEAFTEIKGTDKDTVIAQAKEAISSVVTDSELAEKYSDFSAKLNVAYFGGVFSDLDFSFIDDFISATEGTGWNSYMKTILLDTKDNIYCHWPVEAE